MNLEESLHDARDAVLAGADGARRSGDADDSGISELDERDLWAAVDAGIFGDFGHDQPLDLLAAEDGGDGPSADPAESALASLSHLQVPAERRGRLAGRPPIDEYDFEEGPQREAFKLLRQRVRACFSAGVDDRERARSLRWVYTPHEDPVGVTFATCCIALGARPHKLQLRLNYEFYLRWWVLDRALPFESVPLPEELTGELLFAAGEHGLLITAIIWSWPGIRASDIDRIAQERGVVDPRPARELVEATELVMCVVDSYYVTGRRPRPKAIATGAQDAARA
jgi:hypothetical protein